MTVRTPVEVAVLDAAAEMLAREGPHGLSIRKVAAAADVAPMTIYNRFASKAGLLDALFVRGFRRLADQRDGLPDPTEQPLPHVRAFCAAYRRFALGDPGTYALMFERTVADFAPSPDALLTAHSCFAVLVDSISAVQAAGAIVGGDPVELAQRLWASIHGAVSLELHGICFAPDSDQHYEALVETLILGMGPVTGRPGGA